MSEGGESVKPPNIVKRTMSNVVVPVMVGAGLSLAAGEVLGPLVSAKVAAFFHTDLNTFMWANEAMRYVNEFSTLLNLSHGVDLKRVTDLANLVGKSSSELATFASVMATFYLKGKIFGKSREAQFIPKNLNPRYFNPDGTPTTELESLTSEVIVATAERLPDKAIKGAYLVGSNAGGRHKPDSDLDIAVVVEGAPKGARQELDINKKVNPGFEGAANFTQLTRDKIKKGRPVLDVSIQSPDKARVRVADSEVYYDLLRRQWRRKDEEKGKN